MRRAPARLSGNLTLSRSHVYDFADFDRDLPQEGAQGPDWGRAEVFKEAGFTHFRCAAQTPMNLIIEAKV